MPNAICFFLAACSESAAPSADRDPDDARRPDTTPPDAALFDAASLRPDVAAVDAALPDASLPDASLPDASLPDAASPDAALGPECEYTFELRAHGIPEPGDTTPYEVPALGDTVVAFPFRVPWMGEAQALSFHPILDNADVLFEWMLFAVSGAFGPDGAIVPTVSTPSGAIVAMWARGWTPTSLPADVGIELPTGPNAQLVLLMHYSNAVAAREARDRSGVRVCATTRRRPKSAAVHLLGTEVIAIAGPGTFTAVGLCHPWSQAAEPASAEVVHILTNTPWMRRRGRHFTTSIHRADGTVEPLLDVPFDADRRQTYETPATLFPGDRLETICTFENDRGIATFGYRSDDEVCQSFVTAWPIGPLETGGSLLIDTHACLL